MTEHTLLAALLKLLRVRLPKSFVIRKHADYASAGCPDVSITGNGLTSWWEAKHAKPRIIGTELQLVEAKRLEIAGYCRYIVYQESGFYRYSGIVRPSNVGANGYFQYEQASQKEADHAFICNFIETVHGTSGLGQIL